MRVKDKLICRRDEELEEKIIQDTIQTVHTTDDMSESFDLSIMTMKAEPPLFHLISTEDGEMIDDDVKPMVLVCETPPPIPEHVNHYLTIDTVHTTEDMAESFGLSVMTMKVEPPSFHLISNEDEEMSDDDMKPMVLVSESPQPLPEHVNHYLTIQKNLKEECDDPECEEDPLLVLNPDADGKLTPSNPQKPYPCEVCGKCFKIGRHLTEHKLTHTGEKPHECDTCGKCFAQTSTLTRHKVIHTGEKPHKCDTCGKNFAQHGNLTAHKLTHTGEKSHKCDVCGKCFAQISTLARHKVMHTGEKPHKCDTCGKCFAHIFSLTTHKFTHTGEKPHKCDVCGKCFNRRDPLTIHKFTHERHDCDVCGLHFTGRNSLTRHRMEMHTGEKPHKCNVCDESFDQLSQLVNHKLTHTREKRKSFRCDVCGMRLTQNCILKKHKLTAHTGMKLYECDSCGECFSQLFTLAKHKLTHKIFECDVCGQRYSRRCNLTQHKNRTHTTGEKQYDAESSGGQTSAPWGFPRLLRRP